MFWKALLVRALIWLQHKSQQCHSFFQWDDICSFCANRQLCMLFSGDLKIGCIVDLSQLFSAFPISSEPIRLLPLIQTNLPSQSPAASISPHCCCWPLAAIDCWGLFELKTVCWGPHISRHAFSWGVVLMDTVEVQQKTNNSNQPATSDSEPLQT